MTVLANQILLIWHWVVTQKAFLIDQDQTLWNCSPWYITRLLKRIWCSDHGIDSFFFHQLKLNGSISSSPSILVPRLGEVWKGGLDVERAWARARKKWARYTSRPDFECAHRQAKARSNVWFFAPDQVLVTKPWLSFWDAKLLTLKHLWRLNRA